METKIDPHTGEEFIPKRRNQIFANTTNKTAFNNHKAAKIREERALQTKDLNRNYEILKLILNDRNEKLVRHTTLNDLGFKYNCYHKYNKIDKQHIFNIYDIYFVNFESNDIINTKIYKI